MTDTCWWTIATRDDVRDVAYVYRGVYEVTGAVRVVYRVRAASAVDAMHAWGMAHRPPVEYTCTDVQMQDVGGIDKYIVAYTRPVAQRETRSTARRRLVRAWAWLRLEVRVLLGGRGRV
jgi:hypothetical protein